MISSLDEDYALWSFFDTFIRLNILVLTKFIHSFATHVNRLILFYLIRSLFIDIGAHLATRTLQNGRVQYVHTNKCELPRA